MRCKDCGLDQDMTDQEWYDYGQAHCGIKVGDKVKVLREAKDQEMGWMLAWCLGMNERIGQILTVTRISEHGGFQFSPGDFRFPFFVLELVEKAKPESPLPQSILDVIDNAEWGCPKASIKLLVAEILKQNRKEKLSG